MSLAGSTVREFRRLVYGYYYRHPRDLPWRETSDPYAILVSELMLQQTQSQRVIPKYQSFMQRFPTVFRLASASLAEVLRFWQGLGYNRRGKYLHDAAKVIVDTFAGVVPTNTEDLQRLPGVGPYTAGAIVVFAYQQPVALIETNIRRVFIHHFFPAALKVNDKEIMPLIEQSVDRGSPREWYYALMDYGVHLRRLITNPNRRSAHYQPQSRFSGSVREVRGAIVRFLSGNGDASVAELLQEVGSESVRFRTALEGLERDGLLSVSEQMVRLRH